MGRPKTYLTEEERKIANAINSRRCYRKNHPEIQRPNRKPVRVFENESDTTK